jgi:hypothetical protein
VLPRGRPRVKVLIIRELVSLTALERGWQATLLGALQQW